VGDKAMSVGELNAVPVRLCTCDGARTHDLEFEEYAFPDQTIEKLPIFCIENELLGLEVYEEFQPVLKTLESNANWTMFACYAGLIAKVSDGLFFYSFGDIDEAGENSFFVKSDISTLLGHLLDEWGPDAPSWRDHKVFFPQLDEEGLSVGMSYNYEMPDLHAALKSLK
jgi:hypothetical protein